ncbi:MAG: glycosyltransferase family protein, partial [Nanoarchaeota archaeon]
NIKPVSNNVISLPFKNNFLEYLKISKAVISLAGHCTLSEILFYKKAALIYPIANLLEHYQNAQLMKDYVMLGDLENISLISTRNTLNEFLKKLDYLYPLANP